MKIRRFIFEVLDGKLRWRLVRDTLLVLIESLLGAVALVTIAPIIDAFLSAPDQASPITVQLSAAMRTLGLSVSLGGFVAVFLVVNVLRSGFAILVRYCLLRTRYAVLQTLMLGTFRDFLDAQWPFFNEHKQGTLLNTLFHESAVVASAVWLVMLLVANLTQIFFYVVVPFSISWQVTLISLGMAGGFAIPFLLLGKVNYRFGKLGTNALNYLSSVVQEDLSLVKIVMGFGHQRKTLATLQQAVEGYCRIAYRSQTVQAATPFLYEPLGLVALVVTVFAGRWCGLSLSEVAVVFWALRNCFPLLNGAIAYRNTLINSMPSYEQILSLRRRARELRQPSGTRCFTGFFDDITIEHLTFAYAGHEPVLVDISLSIPKGKMVALVGESGVGKSTLIDLIMGFYQPTSGRITFDGIPLHEFDVNSYRQRIGYVPQESVLFHASIRDNLRWANADATDEEILHACRQANAHEFIERFPDGYETVVGDRGVRLSGGQCQRVALARAILRQPALLILDEATSSLDTHSERLIQQAIEAVAKETTVIVIAHRLSTIVNADSIYVLYEGRVVEEGTYQRLVAREGYFSRMTQMQLLEATGAHADV